MKQWGILVLALVLAGSARAEDVTIELRTGERVTGKLVGFGERRYKVKIGDATLSLREEDIKRIEFGDAAKPAVTADVAPVGSASDEDALARAVEIVRQRDLAHYDDAIALLRGIPRTSRVSEDVDTYLHWIQADRDTRNAKAAYDDGDWDKAKKLLESAIGAPGLGPEARASVTRRLDGWGAVVKRFEDGKALAAKGDDAAALPAMDEVLKLEPNPKNHYHVLAESERSRLLALVKPLAVEDVIPKPSELPECFAQGVMDCEGATAIESRRKACEKEGNLGNFIDALVDVSELACFDFKERQTISLVVFGYATPASARDRFVAFRRAAMETRVYNTMFNGSAELFQAGRFNAAIRVQERSDDCGVTAAAQEAFRKIVLAHLERAAPDHVVVESISEPRFTLQMKTLVCPVAWLPERLAVTESKDRVSYSNDRGSVTLAIQLDRAAPPTADETTSLRSAWFGGKTLVTLATTGAVATRTVVWLDRFVAKELARTTRGRDMTRLTPELPEPPEPRLAKAAEGVPRRDEFPACIAVTDEWTTSALAMEEETKKALASSPTTGPLVAALNEDARDRARIVYDKSLLELQVRSYGSVESAAKGFEAAKRARSLLALHGVLWAGNLVALVVDFGESIPAYDLYRRALVARLALATGGEVVSESFPNEATQPLVSERDGGAPRLFVRSELLPLGFTAEQVFSNHHGPSETIFATCGTNSQSPTRNVYRSAKGTVEITAYWSGAFPEPKPEQVKPFRHVWLFDGNGKGVSLKVEGDVPATDVAWFVRFVDAELARSPDAKGARRFDAAAVVTPHFTVEDLLPRASELPACFKIGKPDVEGRTGVEDARASERKHKSTNAFDALEGGEELAKATYTERDDLRLVVVGYSSAEVARTRFLAFRRSAADSSASSRFGDATVVFQAGSFNVAVRPGFVTTFAHEAFLKALRARCERVAPGKVVEEKVNELRSDVSHAISIPETWLPEKLEARREERGGVTIAVKGQPPIKGPRHDALVTYTSQRGSLEAKIYPRSEFASPAPTPEELRAFRAAWTTTSQVVTLATTGEVTTSTLVWFDRYMTAELNRTGETVKRVTPEIASDEPRIFFPGAEEGEAPRPRDFGIDGLAVKAKGVLREKLRVTTVLAGSRAQKLGFKVGDRVTGLKVNGSVKSGSPLEVVIEMELTQSRINGDDLAFELERDGKTIEVKLPEE